MTIEVTGELGNLCAARQAELEVVRKKKNDREAEIKRLRVINAELLETLEDLVSCAEVYDEFHDPNHDYYVALKTAQYAIEKAENS